MSWKQNTMRGMRSNSAVNQPTGGGPKKSGLAASNLGSAGVGLLHGRTYMGGPRGVQANYRNKDLVFHYKSYIGGIGHSVGGRSLRRMMDGVHSISTSPKPTPAPPKPTPVSRCGLYMADCSVNSKIISSTACSTFYTKSGNQNFICEPKLHTENECQISSTICNTSKSAPTPSPVQFCPLGSKPIGDCVEIGLISGEPEDTVCEHYYSTYDGEDKIYPCYTLPPEDVPKGSNLKCWTQSTTCKTPKLTSAPPLSPPCPTNYHEMLPDYDNLYSEHGSYTDRPWCMHNSLQHVMH